MPRAKHWINSENYYVNNKKDWWLGKDMFQVTIKIHNMPSRFAGKRIRIKFEEAPEKIPKDKTPIQSLAREAHAREYAEKIEKARLELKELWGDEDANKPVRDGSGGDRKGRTITDSEAEDLFGFFTKGFDA